MDGTFDFGMVGLGVMGRNFLLNIADNGYSVMGLDTNPLKASSLVSEAKNPNVQASTSATDFVAALKSPRKIMMLVPAGAPVDAVIADLLPLLQKGDLLIDGGNSYFPDTDRRYETLKEKGIRYMGIGISGGEEGARKGPSIMPGGDLSAYDMVKPILAAAAAKVNGEPCVSFMGNRSAGNYVKMVHNGIEYALMQLISEAYHLMKQGLELPDDEIQEAFQEWNASELNSFLIEITADILAKKDEGKETLILNSILDMARQKGTGKWTSQNAMDLRVPVPSIDMAVVVRDISGLKEERVNAEKLFPKPSHTASHNKNEGIQTIKKGLIFAFVSAYAQGFSMIKKASETYAYDINLAEVAKIWRGGCIIRASMLEDFRNAFIKEPALQNLLIDAHLSKVLAAYRKDISESIKIAMDLGIPVAGLMSAVAYFDLYSSGWLPLNLIQAQRDYFGAHTYERTDKEGFFHTEWK